MPAALRNAEGRVGQQIPLAEFFKDVEKNSAKVPSRFDVEKRASRYFAKIAKEYVVRLPACRYSIDNCIAALCDFQYPIV